MSRKVRVATLPALTLALVALVLNGTGLWAQPPQENWHFMYFQAEIPLELDQSMVAVHNPENLPDETVESYLTSVGFTGFIMEPAGRPWFHFVREPDQGPGNPGPDIIGLITSAAARPDNPFFLTPVFRGSSPDVIIYPSSGTSVRFVDGMPPAAAEAEIRRAGIVGEILDRAWLRTPNIYRLGRGTKSGIELLRNANALARQNGVVFASPGFRSFGKLVSGCFTAPNGVPNDPFYQARSWGTQIVGLDTTRDICIGDPAMIVAVLDDGVDFHLDLWRHEGFERPGNMARGAQCTIDCVGTTCSDSTCDAGTDASDGVTCKQIVDLTTHPATVCAGLPQSPCGRHGTLVASVIAGNLNNGEGSAGIAPAVSIMPVKIGRYAQQEPATPFDFCPNAAVDSAEVAEGISWAAAQGAKVTTMSWQTGGNFAEVTTAYAETYENDDVIHFVSGGNTTDTNPAPPGGSSFGFEIGPVNSVGAHDELGNRLIPSNIGEGLDFSAPGVLIFMTDRSSDFNDLNDTLSYCWNTEPSPSSESECFGRAPGTPLGGLYFTLSGTSFAAPFVAGTAALIRSMLPGASALGVEAILRMFSDDLGDPGYDIQYGHGRPNTGEILETLDGGLFFVDDFESGDLRTWSFVEGEVGE